MVNPRMRMRDSRCWVSGMWLWLMLQGAVHRVAVGMVLQYDQNNKGDLEIHKRDLSDVENSLEPPFDPFRPFHFPRNPEYPIRLVDGPNNCEGRLEIEYNGEWGTVCDDKWDLRDANIVCLQLGCGPALMPPTTAHYGQVSDHRILMDDVECTGFESELALCPRAEWYVNNCDHQEDVGVSCRAFDSLGKDFGDFTTPWPTANGSGTSNGDIRLVNGTHRCEGRVEIYYNGLWGTVCDDEWSMKNAKVVCQQLQCGDAEVAHTNARFGHGIGMIYLDNVNCNHNENKLDKCSHVGWGTHNCGHHEDAGVTCGLPATEQPSGTDITTGPLGNNRDLQATSTTATTTTVTTPPAPAPVRLVGGADRCSGRLEIQYANVWGTVCDDYPWGIISAEVVCMQLGCGPALEAKFEAYFGAGSGPIYMDNVDCIGNEAGLSDCFYPGWMVHNCVHSEDAGVICASPSTTPPPSTATSTASSEELARNLAVAGKPPTKQAATAPPTTTPPSEILRLVGGNHSCEGRVEVYLNDTWGTVCDDAWDLLDAQVVCRQVGCGKAVEATQQPMFGAGTGRIQMDNLKCKGTEISLVHCSHITWNVHNCDHSEDAGVICLTS